MEKTVENKVNYGFVKEYISSDEHFLGGGFYPEKKVLRTDGDWSKFLPVSEYQAKNFETWGCTCFGTLNAIETLLNCITKKESNFSDRFIYIQAKVREPGSSPHFIAETIRDTGLILEEKLPMTSTYEEYKKPDPLPVDLLVEGQHFLNSWNFNHEWCWTNDSEKRKKERLQEALLYSPVCVSVHAWKKEGKIYVKSTFDQDNHWCMLFLIDGGGYYHIFDTYDNDIKILSPDYDFEQAKFYIITERTTPRDVQKNVYVSILQRLINFLKELFARKVIEEKIAVLQDAIKKKEEDGIIEPMDKLIKALIHVESGGDDNAIGDKNLAQKAYGCLQIRQPCIDDALPGHKAQECLGNRELSIKVFNLYMKRYATAKRLGREPTNEDKARIWNGGPYGYRKISTVAYWNKVKLLLN